MSDLDNFILLAKKMIDLYPECKLLNIDDTIKFIESKNVKNATIDKLLKNFGVSFNTVEEALSKAQKGNYIVLVGIPLLTEGCVVW